MTRDEAEIIGLKVLEWMARDPEQFESFMAHAGTDRDAIAESARDPLFLGALLDFLMMSDDSILRFADDHKEPPEAIAAARAALPGGNHMHWT